jgi:hypothetical protein
MMMILLYSCKSHQGNNYKYNDPIKCLNDLNNGSIVVSSFGTGPNYWQAVRYAKVNAIRTIISQGVFLGCTKPSLINQIVYADNKDYFQKLLNDKNFIDEYSSCKNEFYFTRILRHNYGSFKHWKIKVELTIRYDDLKLKIMKDLKL